MQFEDFDKKLKQAAEQHHPNYDENAWSGMEKLLDRHLPQKKESRRRFLFILLFLLLIGTGTWLLIDRPWQKDNRVAGTTNDKPDEQRQTQVQDVSREPANNNDNKLPGESGVGMETSTTPTTGGVNDDKMIDPGDSDNITQGVGERRTATGIRKDNTETKLQTSVSRRKSVGNNAVNIVTESAERRKRVTSPGQEGSISEINSTVAPTAARKNKSKVAEVPASDSSTQGERVSPENEKVATVPGDKLTGNSQKTDAVTTNEQGANVDIASKVPDTVSKVATTKSEEAAATPKAKKVNPAKRSNSLFISLSAGPDISAVGFSNPGKVRLLTGVGLGYTFMNRWTLRTGFYTSSKVYSAKPADYKPSTVPPAIDYLKNISADCKVYEIPVELLYNFGRTAKRNFYAGAGLSSFLMKREEYEYLYQYPGAGQTWTYLHTEDNKNKHYFSVISITAGYEQKITKAFSLTAAPYLKLPLAGVGYGKVKLNSAGILVSVKYTPLQGNR